MEGVESVEVDFGRKTATVYASEGIDREALVTALEKAGFDGELN